MKWLDLAIPKPLFSHRTSSGHLRRRVQMKAVYALVGLLVLFLSVSSSSAVTLHATDDTNVNLAQLSQINGASVDVFVRNVGTGGERHAYVRFDTSIIAPNTAIDRVQLRMWVSAVSTAGPIDLYVVTRSWDEATLNAVIEPTRDPTPFATKLISVADQDSYVTVDVTTVVRDWVNGARPNFGIALLPNSAGVRVTLNSKENTGTSHPMEVEVVVSQASTVPAGAVMAFNLSTCPQGWSPLAVAVGRVIVGGGTVGTATGSPLPDGGLRLITKVPKHAHVIRILSTDQNPHRRPAEGCPPNDPIHCVYEPQAAEQLFFAGVQSTYEDPPGNWGVLTGKTGVDEGGVGGGYGGGSVDVSMPYLQLLYCQKN